jgi:hypothetical protein
MTDLSEEGSPRKQTVLYRRNEGADLAPQIPSSE